MHAFAAAPAFLSAQQISFKLLIVDDSRIFRKFLVEALQARIPFLTLATATGAQDALEQIQFFRPDLIFMDVRVADGSGFAIVRRLRQAAIAATVVIFTSFDIPEYREEAFRSGADHYLVKGAASVNDIFRVVESTVASRAAR
jgi:DNA-binding NarL/FixJ family response regulator